MISFLMKRRLIAFLLCLILVIIPLFFSALIGKYKPVSGQVSYTTPFLISPFYGHKPEASMSWFDHVSPEYSILDHYIVRYDGIQREVPLNKDCFIDAYADNCYDGHGGIDFPLVYETVLAAADGEVSFAGWEEDAHHYDDYGLHIKIKHFEGGKEFYTLYGHLSTTAVSIGEAVKAGQVIGTSGNNGNSSGPHLHFGVYVKTTDYDFKQIDPFGWNPSQDWINEFGKEDPWETKFPGAKSECLWKAGQFANYCDEDASNEPLPMPETIAEYIVDYNDGSGGFRKGVYGPRNEQCAGIDDGSGNPECREWYQTLKGEGGHTFRTIADGLGGSFRIDDNWASWENNSIPAGPYEVLIKVPQLEVTEEGKLKTNTFTWQANYHVKDCYGRDFGNRLFDEYIGAWDDGTTGTDNTYDKWLSIGTYCMDWKSYVYLTDVTDEGQNNHCKNDGITGNNGWCRLLVDAIKLIRRSGLGPESNYLPIILRPSTPTPIPTTPSFPGFYLGEAQEVYIIKPHIENDRTWTSYIDLTSISDSSDLVGVYGWFRKGGTTGASWCNALAYPGEHNSQVWMSGLQVVGAEKGMVAHKGASNEVFNDWVAVNLGEPVHNYSDDTEFDSYLTFAVEAWSTKSSVLYICSGFLQPIYYGYPP